jgi:hypothetical protein
MQCMLPNNKRYRGKKKKKKKKRIVGGEAETK